MCSKSCRSILCLRYGAVTFGEKWVPNHRTGGILLGKTPDSLLSSIRGFLGVLGGKLPSQVMFTFGSESNFTIGELVHFEPDAIGQELLTIKMRPQFGFLPHIKEGVLSAEDQRRVESALDDVVQGYRSSPPAQ